MVLPCLMRVIRPPEIKDGKPRRPRRPGSAVWIRDVADAVLAFPQLTHWELDNEYDLNRAHFDAETAVGLEELPRVSPPVRRDRSTCSAAAS